MLPNPIYSKMPQKATSITWVGMDEVAMQQIA